MSIERKKALYEILIPAYSNEGKRFPVNSTAEWLGELVAASGGYTEYPAVKGAWVGNGKMFYDTNIPYRVLVTRADFVRLLGIAKKKFNQEAIFGYKVSEEVLIYS